MVLRWIPDISDASRAVSLRPNFLSFSCQQEIMTAFIISTLQRYFGTIDLTLTQEYGIIVSARFLSGSTIKSGFQAYFGQYTCPDCMFTQGPGSLGQYGWGNFISQNGRSGRKLATFIPLLSNSALEVLKCSPLFYTLHTYLCKRHSPKSKKPRQLNTARFYFTPMVSLLAYFRCFRDEN